jgi:hypothetical protein
MVSDDGEGYLGKQSQHNKRNTVAFPEEAKEASEDSRCVPATVECICVIVLPLVQAVLYVFWWWNFFERDHWEFLNKNNTKIFKLISRK